MDHKDQTVKADTFHHFHQRSSTFVLPNAWDVISAKMFEESGFAAIGTTSGGIAASLGYKDGQNIPPEKMIEVIENIANSVNVPVSADIEAGYGETVKEVAGMVKKIMEAGVVGINLEDNTGDPDHQLYDLSLQMEKIAAIKKLSDITENTSLFLNARTDTYWLSIGNPAARFQETVKRAKGFEEAGADCIFIPGLNDREIIKKIRDEISLPINLLVSSETPSLAELSEIGIERLSCGSGPFRASVSLLQSISKEIINNQTFHQITDGVLSYKRIMELMK